MPFAPVRSCAISLLAGPKRRRFNPPRHQDAGDACLFHVAEHSLKMASGAIPIFHGLNCESHVAQRLRLCPVLASCAPVKS